MLFNGYANFNVTTPVTAEPIQIPNHRGYNQKPAHPFNSSVTESRTGQCLTASSNKWELLAEGYAQRKGAECGRVWGGVSSLAVLSFPSLNARGERPPTCTHTQ